MQKLKIKTEKSDRVRLDVNGSVKEQIIGKQSRSDVVLVTHEPATDSRTALTDILGIANSLDNRKHIVQRPMSPQHENELHECTLIQFHRVCFNIIVVLNVNSFQKSV